MKIYKADLVEKYRLTFKEAGTILEAIDQDAIIEEYKKSYSHEIWDEVTPINGVQPDVILAKPDMPRHREKACYMIYKDGRLVYFQYTNPFEGGNKHMTAAEIPDIATRHIAATAENNAAEAIWEKVKEEMENL